MLRDIKKCPLPHTEKCVYRHHWAKMIPIRRSLIRCWRRQFHRFRKWKGSLSIRIPWVRMKNMSLDECEERDPRIRMQGRSKRVTKPVRCPWIYSKSDLLPFIFHSHTAGFSIGRQNQAREFQLLILYMWIGLLHVFVFPEEGENVGTVLVKFPR